MFANQIRQDHELARQLGQDDALVWGHLCVGHLFRQDFFPKIQNFIPDKLSSKNQVRKAEPREKVIKVRAHMRARPQPYIRRKTTAQKKQKAGCKKNMPKPNARNMPKPNARDVSLWKSSASGERTCAICIEKFQVGEHVRTLPCCHTFHVQEIDQWLAKARSCPICKTSTQ